MLWLVLVIIPTPIFESGWVKTFAETLSATGTVNGSLPAAA